MTDPTSPAPSTSSVSAAGGSRVDLWQQQAEDAKHAANTVQTLGRLVTTKVHRERIHALADGLLEATEHIRAHYEEYWEERNRREQAERALAASRAETAALRERIDATKTLLEFAEIGPCGGRAWAAAARARLDGRLLAYPDTAPTPGADGGTT